MSSAVKSKIGKLKAFGLEHLWQVAFLFPSRWEDFRNRYLALENMSGVEDGSWVVFECIFPYAPQLSWKTKQPILKFYAKDRNGEEVGCSAFGDTRELKKVIEKHSCSPCFLKAKVSFLDNNRMWLSAPEIIPRMWIDRCRPVYPGKTRVINPDTVRVRVFENLKQSIPIASQWLTNTLQFYGDKNALERFCNLPEGMSLEQLIYCAHFPNTPEQGERAHKSLMRLACLGVIKEIQKSKCGETAPVIHTLGFAMSRAYQLQENAGFILNDDQIAAIDDISNDLASPNTGKRLLSGDVGSGKTAVYGTAAAGLADCGGRSVIILPNTNLSVQVFQEMSTWWPDLPIRLVTGDQVVGPEDAPITLGTTALLFDNIEKAKDRPELLVVDEQQKFSREQREQLMGPTTRLLEATATPIPRSFALLKYGAVKVSKIPARKGRDLYTFLWTEHNKRELFHEVKRTLSRGEQVAVIYSQKEETEGTQLQTLEEGFALWSKAFPGDVVCAHGGNKEQAQESLEMMKSNQAKILVATTVIEVGITIPKLHHEIIVHPERHGLVTLHQLRGRLARLGGVGRCDLYLPKQVSDKTMERLQVFCSTTDGFKLADMDMRLRGMGDLSVKSENQSGADETFMFGKNLDVSILNEVLEEMSLPDDRKQSPSEKHKATSFTAEMAPCC